VKSGFWSLGFVGVFYFVWRYDMVNGVNLFESNVGSMVREALCAAAMLVAFDGVWGMDVIYDDDGIPRFQDGSVVSYDCEDKFLTEYANRSDIWKADGERFLTQQFVNEYVKTGIAPLLADGRPELTEWFDYTINNGAFTIYWGSANALVGGFIQNMLEIYSKYGIVPDYISSQARIVAACISHDCGF
jgi:hypothetical protein